jgi:hypothetical protein
MQNGFKLEGKIDTFTVVHVAPLGLKLPISSLCGFARRPTHLLANHWMLSLEDAPKTGTSRVGL